MTQPDLDNITATDLSDDERLSTLYLEAVRRKFWPNNLTAVLEFWCFAAKALKDDRRDTPGKLFYSLIKRKDTRFITDATEQEAMCRMSSDDRQQLVARAGGLNDSPALLSEETEFALFGSDKENVGYMPSVMMQCFLPQSERPLEQRRFRIDHGRVSLVIEAGLLANPAHQHDWKECGLPHGSRPRLIIPFINSFAIVRRTRDIDLGKSLRQFMEKIGSPITGYNGKKVTKQVEALAAAQFYLGEWHDNEVISRSGKFSDAISFWIERDPSQGLLWTPTMQLSQNYYDAINDRHVPVDMTHLAKLTRSPRRMDLYSWLSYRLPTIGAGKSIRVPLHHLRPIFAPDIQSPKLFKQRLGQDLKAITKVYRGFRVDLRGELFIMEKSLPPVPRKVTHLIR